MPAAWLRPDRDASAADGAGHEPSRLRSRHRRAAPIRSRRGSTSGRSHVRLVHRRHEGVHLRAWRSAAGGRRARTERRVFRRCGVVDPRGHANHTVTPIATSAIGAQASSGNPREPGGAVGLATAIEDPWVSMIVLISPDGRNSRESKRTPAAHGSSARASSATFWKPSSRIARHRAHDRRAEPGRELGTTLVERLRFGLGDLDDQLAEALRAERQAAAERVIEDDAERVHVAARVDRTRGADLLRRHVVDRADQRARDWSASDACPSPR